MSSYKVINNTRHLMIIFLRKSLTVFGNYLHQLPAATVAASGSLALDHTGNKQRKSLEVHFHTINIKNGI